MRIYSLKALARHEDVEHSYLRKLVTDINKGKIEGWRGYKFFGIEGKCWFAYINEPEDLDIHV